MSMLAYIREVFDTNINWSTAYSAVFRGFTQLSLDECVTLILDQPVSLPFLTFQIHRN
jgi:hypothetical protein